MPQFGTTARLFGGLAIDRAYFRTRLPDFQWRVRAAGLVNPGDANQATLALGYVSNAGTFFVLGSAAFSGAGVQKFTLGPFDVFNPAIGHPLGEPVPIVRLRAVKNAGVNGDLAVANLWFEIVPARGAA